MVGCQHICNPKYSLKIVKTTVETPHRKHAYIYCACNVSKTTGNQNIEYETNSSFIANATIVLTANNFCSGNVLQQSTGRHSKTNYSGHCRS
jgi:hypothetical protein